MRRRIRFLAKLLLGSLTIWTLIYFTMIRVSFGDYSSSPQSRDGRFQNLRPAGLRELPESTLHVWREFLFNKPPGSAPDVPLPVYPLTRAELDAAPDRSLYRLGHSTVLMKLRGQWWLTDPVFCERASPVQFTGPKRFHAPPIALDDLPPIRAVILSHDHYDHLDRAAVKVLRDKADLFLAPLGVGDRLAHWGVTREKIRQLDWWENTEVDGLRLTATPSQHFSGRGFFDGNKTLWASWVIEDGDFSLFFGGDSGYFDGFSEIGRRFGPFDITLIESGAYNEQWPYVHMHPSQTVQAHRDLGGRWLLPIHNGTFDLAMHIWEEPLDEVLRLATEATIDISMPMIGERVDLNAPHAGTRWWLAEDKNEPENHQLIEQ